MRKQFRALEAKVAQGIVLTDAQVVALEKANVDKKRTENSSANVSAIFGAQDTFCVGTLNGVGWVSNNLSHVEYP